MLLFAAKMSFFLPHSVKGRSLDEVHKIFFTRNSPLLFIQFISYVLLLKCPNPFLSWRFFQHCPKDQTFLSRCTRQNRVLTEDANTTLFDDVNGSPKVSRNVLLSLSLCYFSILLSGTSTNSYCGRHIWRSGLLRMPPCAPLPLKFAQRVSRGTQRRRRQIWRKARLHDVSRIGYKYKIIQLCPYPKAKH